MADDEIIVPGTPDITCPGGLLLGGRCVDIGPAPTPFPPWYPVPGGGGETEQPPPEPSLPPTESPPPPDEDIPEIVVPGVRDPDPDVLPPVFANLEAQVPFAGLVAGAAVPIPRRRPRPRRAPKKAPPKRTPRRRTSPSPRVRPLPKPSPLGRLAALARGFVSRLGGGLGAMLYSDPLGPNEPPSGDPIYGGYYADPNDDPMLADPGFRGLLAPVDELEVRATPLRPSPYVPRPLPAVEFPFAPLPGPLFGAPLGGVGISPSPGPSARPGQRPAPVTVPIPSPGVNYDPLPFSPPQPRPRPAPSPRPNPSPAPGIPTFLAPPLPVGPTNKPGTLTLPQPFPVPQTETDPCNCAPKKKPRKERKERDVCYKGTFFERRRGLSKIKREKIPCQ